MTTFLDIILMDGYGYHVWSVLLIFLILLFINIFWVSQRLKKLLSDHKDFVD